MGKRNTSTGYRASPGWTAEGGCPHTISPVPHTKSHNAGGFLLQLFGLVVRDQSVD